MRRLDASPRRVASSPRLVASSRRLVASTRRLDASPTQALNEKLLEAVKAVPETAEYRKSIEATCGYRLKVLQGTSDEDAIEEVIGMGQLEELIESQTEEMGVLDMYVEHKMWEAIADLNTEFKNAE